MSRPQPHRKRFIFISVALWLILFSFVVTTSPSLVAALPVFFVIVFAALFATFYLVLGRLFPVFLISLFIVICLILQYFHLFHPLNLFLLSAFFFSIYIFSR